mgnify:CR=1 FL=1
MATPQRSDQGGLHRQERLDWKGLGPSRVAADAVELVAADVVVTQAIVTGPGTGLSLAASLVSGGRCARAGHSAAPWAHGQAHVGQLRVSLRQFRGLGDAPRQGSVQGAAMDAQVVGDLFRRFPVRYPLTNGGDVGVGQGRCGTVAALPRRPLQASEQGQRGGVCRTDGLPRLERVDRDGALQQGDDTSQCRTRRRPEVAEAGHDQEVAALESAQDLVAPGGIVKPGLQRAADLVLDPCAVAFLSVRNVGPGAIHGPDPRSDAGDTSLILTEPISVAGRFDLRLGWEGS